MRTRWWAAAALVALCATVAAPPVVSATTSQSTTTTTHSYDDAHTTEDRTDSLPALWILTGAVVGLGTIAAILILRKPEGRHSQVTDDTQPR